MVSTFAACVALRCPLPLVLVAPWHRTLWLVGARRATHVGQILHKIRSRLERHPLRLQLSLDHHLSLLTPHRTPVRLLAGLRL